MIVSFTPQAYCSQKLGNISFKANENPSQNDGIKNDAYYNHLADTYLELYHACGGAGCDDEEIVAANMEKMSNIEKQFKAANRRIADYYSKNNDSDD